MAATSIDVASLHAALDAARTTKELSLRQLAGLLDLTPSTLSRLANGFTPDTVAFTSMVTWLNIPAEESINSGRGGWILGGEAHKEQDAAVGQLDEQRPSRADDCRDRQTQGGDLEQEYALAQCGDGDDNGDGDRQAGHQHELPAGQRPGEDQHRP